MLPKNSPLVAEYCRNVADFPDGQGWREWQTAPRVSHS